MSISCGAKVEILAHFVNEQTYVLNASNNAKSTYVGGMKSSTCTFPGNIDLPGVKLLASSNSFVGGAQFDHPVSLSAKDRREEGCPQGHPAVRTRPPTTPSPTSSMRLKVKPIFHLALASNCSGNPLGQSALIQWVSVDYNDIKYAKAEVCPSPSDAAKSNTCTTMLDLLNETQYYLSEIAKINATLPGPSCPAAKPPCLPPSSCSVPSTICQGCSTSCPVNFNAVCHPGVIDCSTGKCYCLEQTAHCGCVRG